MNQQKKPNEFSIYNYFHIVFGQSNGKDTALNEVIIAHLNKCVLLFIKIIVYNSLWTNLN